MFEVDTLACVMFQDVFRLPNISPFSLKPTATALPVVISEAVAANVKSYPHLRHPSLHTCTFLDSPSLQVLPDPMAEGDGAGESLALLGVVAAERQQLFANPTGAALLLLAHSVVGNYPPHLLTAGQSAGSCLAAASMLQVLDAPSSILFNKSPTIFNEQHVLQQPPTFQYSACAMPVPQW